RVDLAAVHERLFPGWMIAEAHGDGEAAFAALPAEAGRAANPARPPHHVHPRATTAPLVGARRTPDPAAAGSGRAPTTRRAVVRGAGGGGWRGGGGLGAGGRGSTP